MRPTLTLHILPKKKKKQTHTHTHNIHQSTYNHTETHTQFHNLPRCHFVTGFQHLQMGLTHEINKKIGCTNHKVTLNYVMNLGVFLNFLH